MPPILTITLLSLSSILTFLFSLSPFVQYAPQLLALLSLVLISTIILKKSTPFLFMNLVSCIVNLVIFTTNGLNSPVFFLVYFLLFTLAFQNPPSTTLSYTLVLILLLSQSLNSPISLIPLISLVFISPLAYFIGRQFIDNQTLGQNLADSETDIFFWLHLKFKTGITVIIDAASQLLSNPGLTPAQKDLTRLIRDSSKNLLNSSQKLSRTLNSRPDETNKK